MTLAIEPLNRFETFFLNTAADASRLAGEIGHPNVEEPFVTEIDPLVTQLAARHVDNGIYESTDLRIDE